MFFLKTGGLLTQLTFKEKCTLGGQKGRSHNTGGLKDRFDSTMKMTVTPYTAWQSINTCYL